MAKANEIVIDLASAKRVPASAALTESGITIHIGIAGELLRTAGMPEDHDGYAAIHFTIDKKLNAVDYYRFHRSAYITDDSGQYIISIHLNEFEYRRYMVTFNAYRRVKCDSGLYITPEYLGSRVIRLGKV